MKNLLLLFFLQIYCALGSAQGFSTADNIFHFTKEEYRGGSQNWGIAQDKMGRIYFANNDGLLSFDGRNWELHPLPNQTIIRSIFIGKDDKIYIGSQEELGYFYPNKQGKLVYTSLKNKIPKEKQSDFADVWRIESVGNSIFFMSNRQIFKYEKDKIEAFSSENWSFLGAVNNKMFAYNDNIGLLYYDNNHWNTYIPNAQFPAHIQMTGILPINEETLLICTLTNGLFSVSNGKMSPFKNEHINEITKQNIYKILPISKDKIAIITNFSGCYIINYQGKILTQYNRTRGLQNNNILSSFVDKSQNLWLGLDNGIDLIETRNPNKNIIPDFINMQAGNISCFYQGHMFLGNSSGLYEFDSQSQSYSLIKGTEGPILGLNVIQNHLLIGTVKSAFSYDNHVLKKLNQRPTGFWNFTLIPNTNIIVCGTFNGLHFFKISDKEILELSKEAIFESARYVGVVNHSIFAMHPYKGLYITKLDSNFTPISTIHIQDSKLISSNQNHLFQYDSTVILSSNKGSFIWNMGKNSFEKWTNTSSTFSKLNFSFLQLDSLKNIWFINNKKIGVLPKINNSNIVWFNEFQGRIQNEENQNISIVNQNKAVITGDHGFYYVNPDVAEMQQDAGQFYFSKIAIQKNEKLDSILFGGYSDLQPATQSIKHDFNSITFAYQLIHFNKLLKIKYSYYLEGYDRSWSTWSERTEKSYTQLPKGKYIFKVKAENELTGKIQEISYAFSILPPWYETWWFYTFCFLVLVIAIVQFSRFQHHRYLNIQRKKLESQEKEFTIKRNEVDLQHRLELEQKNKSIIELQNAKLTNELKTKNATIATNAMALAKKSEAFIQLKDELQQYPEMGNNSQFKKLLKKVESQIDNQSEWDQFLTHFDSVHDNFIIKLKEKIPTLTASEKKLCALLKLELSSKEIAEILNISLKGVEVARYRLRKKLNLGQDINLNQYFHQLIEKGES
ncbi:helix-turn-helix and ligand-binding sensor domain-containing protein [Rhizosphaericola mali]|uniref:HTH luxR-type domain-containing protein n=1 Tax=Rhizosphaericola mali TaxID=2545455 RepID=A0A5P2FZ68_9BACT|nr:triple tyrosine motif-containing protein [Rhizosphaericola mali]QES87688.1 hypothetical protein E0W69_003075 [Rhizosphaericola mali]